MTTLPSTETIDGRYRDLDSWPPGLALTAMWEAQLAAVAAVRDALPAIERAVSASVPRLATGGRIAYCGAGTSGRIGVQDGAELPPTFDWPREQLVLLMAGGDTAFTRSVEGAEDDEDAARADIAVNGVGAGDVLLAIAASGNTSYTVACARAARSAGALTIGISNNADGALVSATELAIVVDTGAEVIAGSTRMKAGTAQKVVLNLFSTMAMVSLGRVFDGLMVDMTARNAKLRTRAMRMLQHLTGASDEAARSALDATGWRVKPAVLVVRGMEASDALARLERHGGWLRGALADG